MPTHLHNDLHFHESHSSRFSSFLLFGYQFEIKCANIIQKGHGKKNEKISLFWYQNFWNPFIVFFRTHFFHKPFASTLESNFSSTAQYCSYGLVRKIQQYLCALAWAGRKSTTPAYAASCVECVPGKSKARGALLSSTAQARLQQEPFKS